VSSSKNLTRLEVLLRDMSTIVSELRAPRATIDEIAKLIADFI
jgi:hypothetical protein